MFPSLEIALLRCISGDAAGRAAARRCVLGHRSAIFLAVSLSGGVGMRPDYIQLLHAGGLEVGSAMGLPSSCRKFPVEV